MKTREKFEWLFVRKDYRIISTSEAIFEQLNDRVVPKLYWNNYKDFIQNGIEPVWSCNSANLGSRKLANKLGFEEVKRIPYYRLGK